MDVDVFDFKPNFVSDYFMKVTKDLEQGFGKTLFFNSYIDRVYKDRYKKITDKDNKEYNPYPRTIKIPKDIDSLKKGDFEPARIIKMEKPEYIDLVSNKGKPDENKTHTPIWFGDASHLVNVALGYVNGDVRKPSPCELSDAFIHMLNAGATGMGKSVTINNIICSLCLEYAPWELRLTLSDAKVVEFKTYALGLKIPHIATVAATGDSDFLISVVSNLLAEYKDLNNVFTLAGVKNLEAFRKKTGLTFPVNIAIYDEFQIMFENAGKQRDKLTVDIDALMRLGRNGRYHQIMCSQQLGGAVPKDTIDQMKVRAALGCSSDVSTQIIGNDAAKNIQEKGKLIMNTAVGSTTNKEMNKLHKVPFIPDDMLQDIKLQLENLGKKYDFFYPFTFYDEEDKLYDDKYDEFIKKFKPDCNSIYLGEPSYMLPRGRERIQKISYNNIYSENICIINSNITTVKRYVEMVMRNVKRDDLDKPNLAVGIIGDKFFSDSIGISKYLDVEFLIDNVKDEDKEHEYNVMMQNPFRRKLMIDIDERLFSLDNDEIESTKNAPSFNDAKQFLLDTIESNEDLEGLEVSDINIIRAGLFLQLMDKTKYKVPFRFSTDRGEVLIEGTLDNFMPIFHLIMRDYRRWGCEKRKIEVSDLPIFYIPFIGFSKIRGLGTRQISEEFTFIKSVFEEGPKYNFRFILIDRTIEDFEGFMNYQEFFILDGPEQRFLSRIKCEDYPSELRSVLGVLYLRTTSPDKQKSFKFKKLMYDGE